MTLHQLYWAIDSEFMMSGRKAAAEDVHSIQFSNGDPESSVFIENASELKQWLKSHGRIRKMYAFNVAPEVGSLRAMLGESYRTHTEANEKGAIKYTNHYNKKVAHIKYNGFDCMVYDIQGLCTSLGFKRLKDVGKYLGFPKDESPPWIGIRKWQNPEERDIFVKYSLRDAEITALAAQMLYDRWHIDPEKHASIGTVAGEYFEFPRRLEKKRNNSNQIFISPLEDRVRRSTFAGRSECFRTGYMPDIYYNDVKSLYPSSMLATRCLQIIGAKQCELSELDLTGMDPKAWGWIDGSFEIDANRTKWGIPKRAKNNIYMVGNFSEFYNTYDLAAAKARVKEAELCYKPVFSEESVRYHNKLSQMYFAKLNDGNLKEEQKRFYKAVMNSASGKLGQGASFWKAVNKQSHASFPAKTSNYFAYNALLAHSHFTMSRLFDLCKSDIIYTDTDSIMTDYDMSGTYFYYTDGVNDIPIILDLKAHGDLSLFRSKRYILDPSSNDGVAIHGWKYDRPSFLTLRYGNVDNIDTRMQVKSTAKTRVEDARKMELGRWYNKRVTLKIDKIETLLEADTKRNRGKKENYNSYRLVSDRKSVGSAPWKRTDMYNIPDMADPDFYEDQFDEYE